MERQQPHKRRLSLPEVELGEGRDSAQKPSRQKRAPKPHWSFSLHPQMHAHAPVPL